MNDTQNKAFDREAMRQRIAKASEALADLDQVSPEVMQQIWARRAAHLAQVPSQEDEGEQMMLVLVRLGHEIYGLEAQYVLDNRPVEQITRVPRVPDWVAGVVNLRGRILSVVDLRRFFGLSPAEPDVEDGSTVLYLVTVETSDMEVVLLVDDVLSVQIIPASRMQNAIGVQGLRPEYVRGVAERKSGDKDASMVVVLDLPALLADEQLIVHEEML